MQYFTDLYDSVMKTRKNTKKSKEDADNGDDRCINFEYVGLFRTYLPQVIASTAKNLLLYQIGLSFGVSLNIIPALRSIDPDKNDGFSITAEQSAWTGSIIFITQPISSILSGFLTEPIGRKYSMILVNIPSFIAWLVLYYAHSVTSIYVAEGLLGFSIGLMEAPVIAYVGEICLPQIRGILLASSNLAASFGFVSNLLMGALIEKWRNMALICAFMPVITAVLLCFIPESPYWYLSRNNKNGGMRSLQWLRGWLPPASSEMVEKEFKSIERYHQKSNMCQQCEENDKTDCEHNTFKDRLSEAFQINARRSMLLAMVCFFVISADGYVATRPFFVQIFKVLEVPLEPKWTAVILSITSLLSGILCIGLVKYTGKRNMFLGAVFAFTVGNCCLAINASHKLPWGTSSFNFNADEIQINKKNIFGMLSFILLAFAHGVGTPIPWMLISEMFPYRLRGISAGVMSAFSYFCMFLATKNQIHVEAVVGLSGSFGMYSILSAIGFIVLYLIMPETENRTLEEINKYFGDKNRGLFDRKIKKILQVN